MVFPTFRLRPGARWLLSALGGPVTLLGFALLFQACGADSESGTGGRRVVLHTRVALAEGGASFTTAVGWSVELTHVSLATGAFYYFDGKPPVAAVPRSNDWELAAGWLGLGTAYAHPGHYEPGNARGQMLEPFSVALLAGPAEFPDGDGVTGLYRSARFSFSTPAAGPAAEDLEEHAAIVEGRAELEGEETRFFRGLAAFDEIRQVAADGHVEGCELSEVVVEGDGTINVTVRPAAWFNLVNFAELDPGSEEEPSGFPADSQPRIAFVQGLTELSAYQFSFVPTSEEQQRK
ncbi:MAG TPA: hypothetical protein VGK73_07240 [Polyangiaceae bacterium]